jgi:hypothetical protein
MNRIKRFPIFLPFVVLSLISCFGGVKKTGKVTGYQPGKVLTKKGFYRVGELSPDWERILKGNAMIAFRNSQFGSSIATDAFCDQAYDDSPLPMLTRHLFAGLQDLKVIKEEPFEMDGRGALRTLFQASLDGVPVKVDAVVIKKNWCLFDFYLVSPPQQYEAAAPAFETFYRGFSYSGDI